jgi:hypothetical protein
VCTQGCCSSEQCGLGTVDFVCLPTKVGGGMCLRATTFSRPAFAPADGSDLGEVGKLCMVGSQCRSGWCDAGSCNDVCCGEGSCGAQACTKRDVNAGALGNPVKAWACGAKPSGGGYAALCADVQALEDPDDNKCSSRVCAVPGSDLLGFHNTYCSKPCCSSTQCANGPSSRQVACDYVNSGGQLLRACSTSASSFLPGIKLAGVGCSGDTECVSLLCISTGGGKYCSDACCSDTDCPAPLVCRPLDAGGTYGLRCVKP